MNKHEIVVVRYQGKRWFGAIEDVGDSLYGVRLSDGRYLAFSKKQCKRLIPKAGKK